MTGMIALSSSASGSAFGPNTTRGVGTQTSAKAPANPTKIASAQVSLGDSVVTTACDKTSAETKIAVKAANKKPTHDLPLASLAKGTCGWTSVAKSAATGSNEARQRVARMEAVWEKRVEARKRPKRK